MEAQTAADFSATQRATRDGAPETPGRRGVRVPGVGVERAPDPHRAHRAVLLHGFLCAWLDAFGHGRPVRTVTARDAAGLRAGLVLVEDEKRTLGMRVRTLTGAANVHSARFDLLANPFDEEGIAALWRQLREDPYWDVLELPDVPVGEAGLAAAPTLLRLAEADGFSVGTWASMQTPFISLGGTPSVERLGSKFRSNLRRRRRLLSEVGEVSLERIEGGDQDK